MATIIKFDLKELRKLVNDKNSCVIEKTVIQNIALQPWCLGNLKESIKNLLDYKIGKFDKEFKGILLSYKNLRILQNVGTIRNDNADILFQVQADYFTFCPYTGATLRGVVNKKHSTHLGIIVHRVFNVIVPRPTEEPGRNWIGENVQEGQHVTFRIVVLDLYGALPYIRGELDERSLKLVPDEDEEYEDLNITYVNFDKTKPHTVQKHIGDCTQESNVNSLQNYVNNIKTTTVQSNGKSPEEAVEVKSSKIKNERQIKKGTLVSEPISKQIKKHKSQH